MKRRSFMELIGRAIGWTAVAPVARAVPARAIELQRSPVAGFQYHQGQALWAHLRVGDPLALIREPDNPFDTRAVRLDWRGRTLGYVPRVENAAVAHLLDSGQPVEAKITALQESDNP